jgi:F-type H+-transporting ATPase subunit a
MARKIRYSEAFKPLFILLFFVLSFSGLKAQHAEKHGENYDLNDTLHYGSTELENPHEHKSVDIAKVAFEHILDSHSWHLWGEGHEAVAMPLPVIIKTDNGITAFMSSAFHHDTHGMVVVEKNGERLVNYEETIYCASAEPNAHGQYLDFIRDDKGEFVIANAAPLDFSITKNAAQLIFSALVLILLFTSIARAYKRHGVTDAPRGKQSFFEPLIVFVRDDLAKGNIGAKGEKFTPYLLTVFFLILINNVFGLIPISANLTGNIAFTFVMAVCTLIVTNINGNKHYWGHIFTPHAPKALWPILIPIEIIGIFTKPFALMIRLFANISAGHIIIISLVGLIFMFRTLMVAPIAVPFALFIDVLEVLVAVLQAYIFTMLTALFIGSAVADHNEDGKHDEDDEKLVAAGSHH